MKRWFHQITPCELVIPGQGTASFLMIEFRDQDVGAMVWGDGARKLGHRRLAALDGGSRAPDRHGLPARRPAARDFSEVLDMLAAGRRAAPPAPLPHRPWWRFWN